MSISVVLKRTLTVTEHVLSVPLPQCTVGVLTVVTGAHRTLTTLCLELRGSRIHAQRGAQGLNLFPQLGPLPSQLQHQRELW